LHEVEENGTVYLDLSSSETYWLRVGGGGTDNLKAEINLALNPPNGEEIVSGKFVAQAHSYLDVFDWDYHNRLTAVTHYVAGSGNDTVTMPDGGTTTMNEVYTKHYVYDVHDRLIYEHIIDTDTPTDKRNEAVYVHERGRRVAVFEKSSGVPGTRYRS